MELKDLLENVHVGERNALEFTNEGGKRTVTLEARRLLPEEPRAPKRSESPRRQHEFLSADSLASYLERYGDKATVVFADPTSERISAVLRENADKGFEIVAMKPAVHPLWKPWAEIAGKTLEMKAFAAFVLQNRRAVVQPDGRELALLLQQVRGSVSVEIMNGRGRNAVNGLVVRSRVQGGSEQSDVLELPDTIVLKLPLYVDTDPQEVEIDLCIEASPSGEVTVLVSAGTVAEARVAAFQDMVSRISSATEKLGAVMTFGRPAHGEWAYLAEAIPARP